MSITSEESFLKLLLDGDWELVANSGREFLVCTTNLGTLCFVPMFYQPGRPVVAWQYRDSRLPAGSDLAPVDDANMVDMLNKGLQAALKGRALEAEKRAADAASRPLDDSDIQKAIANVGATRLLRVVAGRTSDPGIYRTYAPESFNIGMLDAGYFPAGLVWLAVDATGNRIGRRAFRGVDETWAMKALAAAEQVAVRKVNRLNRTEQQIAIKDGSFFG